MAVLTADVSPPRCVMPSPAELTVDVSTDAQVGLPEEVTEERIASFVRYILGAEGVSGPWQFGIRFVDDQSMQQAHAAFMGMDTPTDIMTFPYEDESFDLAPDSDGGMTEQGGDVMISVDRAEQHAQEEGWELSSELFFLVSHGVLHVLGWDDATGEDRSRMLERQSSLLQEWLDH